MSVSTQPMTHDDEVQQFYHALGHAISRWSLVEIALARIFAYFVAKDGQSPGANAAFHSAINFNVKLDMTDAAAQWALFVEASNRDDWKTLKNRLGRKSKKRNELAHFMVTTCIPPDDQGFSVHLEPSLGDMNAFLEYHGDPPKLNLNDVRQRAESFKKLAGDLGSFGVKIGALKAPKPLPKSLEQLLRNGPDKATEPLPNHIESSRQS